MFYLKRRLLKFSCFIVFLVISQQAISTENIQPKFEAGAVASPDYYGAIAAKEMLSKDGNAVDAAVATAFTLAVTYPEAGNIGGGGFMTLWYEGKPYFLDYREVAPGKADKDCFLIVKKM